MQTDTDTDVESTQSRQKKGQMKSIFLSDSEEAIMKFVKQHEEFYDKTNDSFRDKQKKKDFGSCLQLQKTCQDCEKVVQDSDMASSFR